MSNNTLKHKYVPIVEQVNFSYWGDPLAPKNYFRIIDMIAHWIGAVLKDGSTINVVQTKEKFGGVRVYCVLAAPELVEDAWNKLRQTPPRYGRNPADVPLEEFKDRCLLSDAQHYRTTYMSAFELWPQYYYAIHGAADWPGLICHTKDEFDELNNSQYHVSCGFELDTPEKLAQLYKLCQFV